MDEIQRAINDIRKDTNELTARAEDPLRTFANAARGPLRPATTSRTTTPPAAPRRVRPTSTATAPSP